MKRATDDGCRRRATRTRFRPIERQKSKSNKIRAPLLLSLLGGSLDGDRRSLDLRGRDDKHYLTFVLEYDERSRGWAIESSVGLSIRVRRRLVTPVF